MSRKFINYYYFDSDKTIGKGCTSKVYKGVSMTNDDPVAIKAIDIKNNKFTSELMILKLLAEKDVPHTVRLLDSLLNKSEETMYMVLEYIKGKELYEYCIEFKDGMPEDIVAQIFKKVAMAVKGIHDINIAHLDLKLENIMYDQNTGEITILDFGFATIIDEDNLLTKYCGSTHYASPEILNNIPYDGKIADMWALGILLYAMLCGYFPYDGNRRSYIFNQIVYGTYSIPDHVSPKASDLVKKLLNHSTDQRLTTDQVLEHPFLN